MAGNDIVQSLARGLDVLDLISRSENGMKVNDVAEELGLKVTTAHNLIRTLASKSYLEKITSPLAYVIGSSVKNLYENSQGINTDAYLKNAMKILADKLSNTVLTYSLVEDKQIVVRYRISPDRAGKIQEPRNQLFNLYGSASGIATMAFMNPDEVIEMRELFPFHEHGIYLWQSPEKLDEYLEQTRVQGYALTPFPKQESFRVACPLKNKKDELLGIVGASKGVRFIKNEDDKKVIISSLKELVASVKQER